MALVLLVVDRVQYRGPCRTGHAKAATNISFICAFIEIGQGSINEMTYRCDRCIKKPKQFSVLFACLIESTLGVGNKRFVI